MLYNCRESRIPEDVVMVVPKAIFFLANVKQTSANAHSFECIWYYYSSLSLLLSEYYFESLCKPWHIRIIRHINSARWGDHRQFSAWGLERVSNPIISFSKSSFFNVLEHDDNYRHEDTCWALAASEKKILSAVLLWSPFLLFLAC